MPKFISDEKVKKWANDPWLLLLSRWAAAVFVVIIIPAAIWVNSQINTHNEVLAVHNYRINQNASDTQFNRQQLGTVATKEDLIAMETRLMAQFAEVREDQRADRQRPD